jgi:2-dehydropantoate 2-reductase
MLWAKFVFICPASAVGSLTRLPMGGYRDVPETRTIVAGLMREVEVVAAAHGVPLAADVVDASLRFMDQAAPHIKPSMQLDIEAGHRTEVESMIGVLGRKGREVGVPTPMADMVYGLLLPIELTARSWTAA